MNCPPRSEWEQSTVRAYDAIAQSLSAYEESLFPDETIFRVRARMGEKPRILDLGCGSGRGMSVFKALDFGQIVGIDLSEELLRIARTRYPEDDFRVGDILRLKEVVAGETFDAFWAVASLMHILPENMPKAVASIREVVRTGAIGFIATPYGNEEALLDAQEIDLNGGVIPEGHFLFRKLWDSNELMAQFTSAGFRVVSPSFHDHYMIYLTVEAI